MSHERPFKDGDAVVTALIWEVDRAVKQAAREGGTYDTIIRHVLNEHAASMRAAINQSSIPETKP